MSKPTFDAQTLSASLRAAKHQPRKRFGQNFLHDGSVIRQMII
jgi:16S rRNA (adenine1518-N6/adenine1519-N6)-dimethyltransferase